MDPFSDSGELFNIQRSFYTGDYDQVLSTDISGFSTNNAVYAQVLVHRAKVALGRAQDVVTELEGASTPELQAVKVYAEYINGSKDLSLKQLDELIQQHGAGNAQVQYFGGKLLHLEGKNDDAIKLLQKHQGSLECVAMIAQVYLVQGETQRAVSVVEEAKRWAQDNIVFNLTESWVLLRQGGPTHCQSAYYIFKELTSGVTTTAKALNGMAVTAVCQPTSTANLDAEERADVRKQREEPLKEALDLDPKNADALANRIATAIISGDSRDEYADWETKLDQVQKDHPSLVDLRQKEELFDKVLTKYKAAA